MLAAVVEKLGEFSLLDVPVPAVEPGSVLLKVMACAICGTDLRMFQHGHRSLHLPQVIGHEVAGVVVEAPGVDEVEPGQRVTLAPRIPCGECHYCQCGKFNLCPTGRSFGYVLPGGFAEYMLIPQEGVRAGLLVPFDAGLAFETACLAEPLSCVLRSQVQSAVGKGDAVVIMGGGPIGWMQGFVARARGAAPIILAEHSPHRLNIPAGSPFDRIVNNRQEDAQEVVRTLTGGRGADVVIVACSSAEAQIESLSLIGRGGRINLFGGLPPETPSVAIDTNVIHYAEVAMMGTHGSTAEDVRAATRMLESAAGDMGRLITDVFPLRELPAAFATAASHHAMKVVVTPASLLSSPT